jgi:class 3 adenylate cyclase
MKEKQKMERRMVTVVFVDVVGSIELAMTEPSAGIDLLMSYMKLIEQSVRASEGTVVKALGDGFMAVFATPAQAVEFAVRIHEKVRDFNVKQHPLREISIRVGLATGEVWAMESDFFGTTVNLAARLASLAKPGQSVCDEATVALAGESQQIQSVFEAEHKLQGFSRKFPVYSLISTVAA